MALPATVKVKISSEAAGYVSMTPVVVQQIPFIELLERIVSSCGSDAVQVAGMLERGVLVSGASRFRWEGLNIGAGDLQPAIDAMPKDEPHRAFDPSRCLRITLVSPRRRLDITAAGGAKRRLFRRSSFWDTLFGRLPQPAYVSYQHTDRADLYRLPASPEVLAHLRESSTLLVGRGLRTLVSTLQVSSIEFVTNR